MYTYIQIIQFDPSVFPLFTPQNKHARISFNAQNDQWANAHLFAKKKKENLHAALDLQVGGAGKPTRLRRCSYARMGG